MGDIELVVTIPEEDYLTFSKLSEKEKTNDLSYYERVIANGTPLKRELDKIRAEILRKSYGGFELGEGFRDGYNTAMVRVLNILDKYKTESE
jgi:hypothetical protein